MFVDTCLNARVLVYYNCSEISHLRALSGQEEREFKCAIRNASRSVHEG